MYLTSSSAPTSCSPEGILQHPISRPIAQAYKQFLANYQPNTLEVVSNGLLGEAKSQEGKVKEKSEMGERIGRRERKQDWRGKIREEIKRQGKKKSFLAGLETRSLHLKRPIQTLRANCVKNFRDLLPLEIRGIYPGQPTAPHGSPKKGRCCITWTQHHILPGDFWWAKVFRKEFLICKKPCQFNDIKFFFPRKYTEKKKEKKACISIHSNHPKFQLQFKL